MTRARRLLRRHSHLLALALVLVLVAANALAQPRFLHPASWAPELAVFAPLALAAMASTPAIVSGGIDVSIGPLMNFVSIVLVLLLLPRGLGRPEVAILVVLALGAAVGTINGILVAVLRYQPVIATLCMLFILSGINLGLVPTPKTAPPNWTQHLAGNIGPLPGGVVSVGSVLGCWTLVQRLPYSRMLFAVGSSDVAAFSAGVDVVVVRVITYALGGLFAAVGGLALTALAQSADPTYGSQYALIGLAAVALGGIPMGGGRGGLLGALLGAASIYLIRNLLLATAVSVAWIQVVYGLLLLVGVVLSAVMTTPPRFQGSGP
jgi:ribose transport system permease protein